MIVKLNCQMAKSKKKKGKSWLNQIYTRRQLDLLVDWDQNFIDRPNG